MSAPARSMLRTEPPPASSPRSPTDRCGRARPSTRCSRCSADRCPTTGSTPRRSSSRARARRPIPGLVAIPGGRFFGYVIGGTLPAALAADWLVSAWDQNAGSSSHDDRDRRAGARRRRVDPRPPRAARDGIGRLRHGRAGVELRVPRRRPPRGARPPRMGPAHAGRAHRAGTHASSSASTATAPSTAPPASSGSAAKRSPSSPADARGSDAARRPRRGARRGIAPGHAIVCLQAGEVHTGAFDPFAELIPLARAHGAWVHVDGAFGLWAAASDDLAPSRRRRSRAPTRGPPMPTRPSTSPTTAAWRSCGIPRTRSRCSAPAATISIYIEPRPVGCHPRAVTPRPRRAGLGGAAQPRAGRASRISSTGCTPTRSPWRRDSPRSPGSPSSNEVPYTQVMFRLDDDAATRALGAAILADGTAARHRCEWDGRAVLRCSMSSWATTPEDIEATLAAFARLVGTHARRREATRGSGGERRRSAQRRTRAHPRRLGLAAAPSPATAGCRSASTRSYCRCPKSR